MNYQISSFEEYQQVYDRSVNHPEEFWAEVASHFRWKKPWDKVLEWDFNDLKVEWFKGATLNITENCLDRHVETQPAVPAIIWEANDPEEKSITLSYKQLHEQVCKCANVLLKNNIHQGDRVCIYMPMIPELAIAVLACARIGAIHSVVFGGFSAQSISDRVNDSACKMIITSDGGFRGAKTIPMKDTVDIAVETCPSVEKVLVVKRTNSIITMENPRDIWWHEAMENSSSSHTAQEMDAEDPLFILYTSGSTGKPKGVVHSSAGYMVYSTYSFQNVFQYQPGNVYFCTADIGWITGHSYIIYGPLAAGATTMMFEGIPTFPDASRFWEIVEKHKVNIFYTAPTAIRSLMGCGDSFVEGKDLSSLRVLGSVGEPINEEAWHWYNEVIGKKKCPIVDTWWQTETGGILISPIAGITKTKPAFATLPLPGVQPILVDDQGVEIFGNNVNGNLCIKFPWPSMIRTTWGDHKRCENTYFSTFKGLYFTGDGCMRDENGYYRITGRVDDVMNISGHRIGTAEVENAINMHPCVVESAVVGYPHDIKGQGIYAYVIYDSPIEDVTATKKAILDTITQAIGPIAKPDKIQFVSGLPKTRSGKIMRRILRKVACGEMDSLGDISTLLNPEIVEEIIANVE